MNNYKNYAVPANLMSKKYPTSATPNGIDVKVIRRKADEINQDYLQTCHFINRKFSNNHIIQHSKDFKKLSESVIRFCTITKKA